MENFAMPQSAALLLEGGSLRGLYTAGALDTLMEEDLYFPAVAGVSAGALNAVNYVAHEPGRSASINLRYRNDPRYFGPMAAFNGGSLFGLNFMLRDIPQVVPFDTETFYHGGQRMVAVATCLQTGKAAYFEKRCEPRPVCRWSRCRCISANSAIWTAGAPAPFRWNGPRPKALPKSSSSPPGTRASAKRCPASG